ncbi:MAG: surface carbohydrate biosynthesis protein [Wenzhouxiangella sp.]
MRTLILPCETRVREFDAKLLLAVIAGTRGTPTIVGSKKSIDLNLDRYPNGVYVGKSVTARSRHNLALARSCDHRVALWDEEGLVWASREIYWRTKVDGATLNEPELLIAWGNDNAAAWREHPEYAGAQIAVCGNPRADLLKKPLQPLFSDEVKAISDRHGRFILINTNFSRVNHIQPRQSRHLKWLREQRPDDPRGGFAAHKFELFHAFIDAIPQLATTLPDINFIIRPHPSERSETWEAIAASLSNVNVARNGNVLAWLLAADGLIHNGCTTALEAFQLGRPALAYRPVVSSSFDHPLPNGISVSCPDLDSLQAAVVGCRNDPEAAFSAQAAGGARDTMAQAMAGLDDEELASERILDALQPLLNNAEPPASSRPRTAGLALGLRRLFRRVEHRLPGTANYRPYLAHMFPDTSLDEVRHRAELMAEFLGLPKSVQIKELDQNVFDVTPVG